MWDVALGALVMLFDPMRLLFVAMGTVLGLIVIQVLNNGLILLDIPSFWQRIAQGILLIAAVSFDQIRQKIVSQRS